MAGINKRPQRFGTDWSRYTPLVERVVNSVSVIDTYETFYSIEGQGYVSIATAAYLGFISINITLRVTIDDIVVYQGKSGARVRGLLESKHVSLSGVGDYVIPKHFFNEDPNASFPYQILGSATEFPYISATEGDISIIHEPIFFNKSLLIEISADTIGQPIRCEIGGGYIA